REARGPRTWQDVVRQHDPSRRERRAGGGRGSRSQRSNRASPPQRDHGRDQVRVPSGADSLDVGVRPRPVAWVHVEEAEAGPAAAAAAHGRTDLEARGAPRHARRAADDGASCALPRRNANFRPPRVGLATYRPRELADLVRSPPQDWGYAQRAPQDPRPAGPAPSALVDEGRPPLVRARVPGSAGAPGRNRSQGREEGPRDLLRWRPASLAAAGR